MPLSVSPYSSETHVNDQQGDLESHTDHQTEFKIHSHLLIFIYPPYFQRLFLHSVAA